VSEWISGKHAVAGVLRGDRRTVHEVLYRPGAAGLEEIESLAAASGIPCRESKDEVRELGAQGIAARCGGYRYMAEADLPAPRGEHGLVVVLDQIQDPQNLGAMVRTAESAGARAVCIPERRAAQISPAVVRASAGATELVPVHRVVNVARCLSLLKKLGYWTVGLAPDGASAWNEVDYTGAVAVVIGAEGDGIRPLVAKQCDFMVRLPMRGRVESLNASAALAAILYEVVRQQGGAGS
jgi:23S rRNA (guanosine2251-2'-O)-methyltransferase